MSEEDYEYDWDTHEAALNERCELSPFLAAFSTWLEGYDYDSWKEAVMPEEGPDGYFMWDHAGDLRSALSNHGINVSNQVWVYRARNGNHAVFEGTSEGYQRARAQQDSDNNGSPGEGGTDFGGSEEDGSFWVDDGGSINLFEIE